MQIRLDIIITFDDETSQEEIKNSISEIINTMWDNTRNVDIIHEDEI